MYSSPSRVIPQMRYSWTILFSSGGFGSLSTLGESGPTKKASILDHQAAGKATEISRFLNGTLTFSSYGNS